MYTDAPEACVWRTSHSGSGGTAHESWSPQGRRIGWVDGDELFLDPDAAFAVANRLAVEQGDSLAAALRTLQKRLREKGHLRSTDANRQTNTVRRTLEGSRREVIHLHFGSLTGEHLTKLTNSPLNFESTTTCGQLPGQVVGQFRRDAVANLTSKTNQKTEETSVLVSLVRSDTTDDASQECAASFSPVESWEEGEVLT
ncbi:MAG: hypothetical protein SGJ19_19175 [Planctomycetia bacterium]|nr:hypothetical protein [Planctomycetia bacterium]